MSEVVSGYPPVLIESGVEGQPTKHLSPHFVPVPLLQTIVSQWLMVVYELVDEQIGSSDQIWKVPDLNNADPPDDQSGTLLHLPPHLVPTHKLQLPVVNTA